MATRSVLVAIHFTCLAGFHTTAPRCPPPRLDAAASPPPDQSEALSAAAIAGDGAAALTLLEEMCAAAEATPGRWPHPNFPRCFDDAIIACSRSTPPDWEGALQCLQRMTSVGLEPRLYAFNGAIAACGRAGQWKECMKLLNQMTAIGVKPDVVSFNAALNGLRLAGQATVALQTLTRMRDRDLTPDYTSYYCVVSACNKGGQAAPVLALVDSAITEGIALSEELLSDALQACGRGKGQAVAAEKLWSLLEDMRATAGSGGVLSVRSYNARLLERGTAGDWRGAVALLNGMAERGTKADASSVSLTARACGRAGAWEAAIALLKGCKEEFGVDPDERLYCSAMQACGKAKEYKRALELLDEAEGTLPSMSFKVYGAAMDAVSKNGGSWKECLELLERMEGAGVKGDAGVYNGALHALQRAGEWQQVHDLLFLMRGEGVTTVETLSGYHKNLWKRAKVEMARAKK